MNRISREQHSNHGVRAGISWLDVLVTTLIVLTLFTLSSIYTVQNSVPAARRAECSNNLRTITLATLKRAENRGARELQFLSVESDEHQTNWVIELLPYLDHAELYRAWHDIDRPRLVNVRPTLRVLRCPRDIRTSEFPTQLSYVANSGYGHFKVPRSSAGVIQSTPHSPITIDWDGDGSITPIEKQAGLATGVFWKQGTTDRFTSSLGFIMVGDGLSQTILYSENVHAGTWNSLATMDIAFVAGLDHIDFGTPSTDSDILTLKDADLGPFAPNRGRVPRQSPGPNSKHRGDCVHFAMADGRVRQASAMIDQKVYLKLMSPNGHRFGQTDEGLDGFRWQR